jgi:hypothetical protein
MGNAKWGGVALSDLEIIFTYLPLSTTGQIMLSIFTGAIGADNFSTDIIVVRNSDLRMTIPAAGNATSTTTRNVNAPAGALASGIEIKLLRTYIYEGDEGALNQVEFQLFYRVAGAEEFTANTKSIITGVTSGTVAGRRTSGLTHSLIFASNCDFIISNGYIGVPRV